MPQTRQQEGEDQAARWRVLLGLCACVVLGMTSWFSAAAVLPQLRALWQMGDAMAGWLTIAVQLGFVLGAVGAALSGLPDRVPPRRLMLVCGLGAALANLGLLWAPGPGSALLLRLLTGVLMAGLYPPAMKLVATWFRAGRGLALGCVIGALTLGSALPHAVNALGGLPWQGVIIAASLATLAGALGVLGLCEGPYPFPRAPFEPAKLRQALSQRAVLLASAGYLGHMWELYAMWSWMLAFLRERVGEGAGGLASWLTFAIVAAGAPGCVLAGRLADRLGRTRTTIGLMAISGGCAAVIGLAYAGPLWLLVLVGLLWGFSIVADSAQFSAIVTEVGEPSLVGTALTVQLGLGFALTGLAIGLLPWAAAAFGSWQWVFLVLLPGPLLGILAMDRLRRLPDAARIAGGRG
ncbi:MFS transporter [Teichococcus cervicalis]|uniref:Transporter, major facilitator family protein n=1 Tax=Pseudoroseomonas cervicalis ATCC 49957 TaxID=525371 RepID=D5RK40_9PROT|nr:MFS transporter [Pseudoroseomonas cervicalis]EFH12322.1 transporter, major facilitator family protein [Pseudoroseomonas cervicalis ATCC 49957]